MEHLFISWCIFCHIPPSILIQRLKSVMDSGFPGPALDSEWSRLTLLLRLQTRRRVLMKTPLAEDFYNPSFSHRRPESLNPFQLQL